MIITHFGGEFFKVQFGDTTIALNPISKESKLRQSRFGTDIALISTNHPDMNGVDLVSHGDKKPFAITGPGEYEIKGIFIKGLPSETNYDKEKRINTIYMVSLENMNICFLGALGNKDLKAETIEALDGIDILFIPIGGDGVLEASDAYKLAVKLEPKLIIPMGYEGMGDKDALKKFLKEDGSGAIKPVDKLTIKKKDLEGKEGEIVVLEATA